MDRFNYTNWQVRFFNLFFQYNATIKYLKDTDAYETHYMKNPNIDKETFEELATQANGERHPMVELMYSYIAKSDEFFRSQFIVYLATLIENLLEECLILVFTHNPNKLRQLSEFYEKVDTELGITLNEILKYETNKELHNALAKRGARLVCRGKITNVIKRLEKVLEREITHETKVILNLIVETRNKIVHEDEKVAFIDEKLDEIKDELGKFTKYMMECLVSFGIGIQTGADFNQEQEQK